MILASAQTSTWEALGQLLTSPYPPEYSKAEVPPIDLFDTTILIRGLPYPSV